MNTRDAYEQQLDRIAELEQDWDSYDAEAPKPEAIAAWRRVLDVLPEGGWLQARPWGEVEFEWERDDLCLTLSVGSGEDMSAVVEVMKAIVGSWETDK